MEKVILSTLCFEISAPTSNWFGSRLVRKAHSDEQTSQLMHYLLELALLDYRYLQFRSSVLACAAFSLANIIIGKIPWQPVEADTGKAGSFLCQVFDALVIRKKKKPTSNMLFFTLRNFAG